MSCQDVRGRPGRQILALLWSVTTLLAFAGGAARAQTATWTGATSTDWATSTNWSGTAPTAASALAYVFGTAANQNTNNTFANNSLTANSITFNTGGFTLGGNSVIYSGTITNGAGTNTISLNLNMDANQAVTVASGTQLTISGVLGNTGQNRNLAANGAGTLILANANTYGGTTTISGGGTVLATNTTGSATGGNTAVNSITVQSTGTLGGSGLISGGIVVQNGGTIRAGTGTGNSTLTLTRAGSALAFGAGATYAAQLYNTGPTDISLINETTAGGNVNIAGNALLTLDLSALSAAQVANLKATVGVGNTRTYTIMQVTATGTIDNFSAGNFSISNLGNFAAGEWTLNTSPAAGTVQVNFTPVPEPASVMAVVLGATAVYFCWRRRRPALV
jgi:hypothetical protein